MFLFEIMLLTLKGGRHLFFRRKTILVLTFFDLSVILSSADNLAKPFGPRSSPTIRMAWSESKLLDSCHIRERKF